MYFMHNLYLAVDKENVLQFLFFLIHKKFIFSLLIIEKITNLFFIILLQLQK